MSATDRFHESDEPLSETEKKSALQVRVDLKRPITCRKSITPNKSETHFKTFSTISSVRNPMKRTDSKFYFLWKKQNR